MPKRGGQRSWNYNNGSKFGAGGSYSDEHDDRDKIPSNTRRVSFKSQAQSRGGLKGRMGDLAIKARLNFDDEDMFDFTGPKHRDSNSDKFRRKGSPIPRGKFGNFRSLGPSTFGWYQVTIPYGQKYDKDTLIRNILNAISPDIFIPHYWKTEKTCVLFYVDDLRTAEKIQRADRAVQMPDGFKLLIRVRTGIPTVQIDETFKERMKVVMAKRYNATTRALDLSKFHADPDFKDIFCALFRPQVMAAALDIIASNIPDLEALNLNDNQIVHLDSFSNATQKLPNLKILYLGENRIQSVASLLAFKGLPIVELVLKSNPLRQRYKEYSQYLSEVRRKFPKLVKLDGKELEPHIVFDVSDTLSLPQPKASFLCDTAGAEIIRQFLEQYFIIFDSDNRQPLLDAYHEQAMISMSVPPASQAGRLSAFWPFNRNLLRAQDNESLRFRLLKTGRLPVVSFLSELPKTQHDPQSFSVDLSLFTPKLISFTVAGLFKELGTSTSSSSHANNSNSEIRYFQRQFVIVPAGGGFCIRNELIFITSATHSQIKTAFKPAAPVAPTNLQNRIPTSQPVPSTSQVTMAATSTVTSLDDVTKLQMIQAMSAQSNMNMEWSKKCLEETNWDFSHAAYVFDKLHKEGKIPPEAFVK